MFPVSLGLPAGTDVSRSLAMTGREFRFPIEHANQQHANSQSSSESAEKHANIQRDVLSKSREIFKILIQEQRAMHREYVISKRPEPFFYQVGDRACQATN